MFWLSIIPYKTLPDDFTLFHYWKEYNLLSFKSEKDLVRISDFWDCFIYFYGFLNLSPKDNFDNTTISLLVNNFPREFLKKFSKFCKELEKGVWDIDSNFCKIYLIELHKINLTGLDRFYLGNFSTDKSFLNLLTKTETIEKDTREANWIDSIQNIIQDRVTAFERDPEIRRKFMATAYEADITDLVKPHLDKAEKRGEQKGKLEKAIETARKMQALGISVEIIIQSVGLSEEQLRDFRII